MSPVNLLPEEFTMAKTLVSFGSGIAIGAVAATLFTGDPKPAEDAGEDAVETAKVASVSQPAELEQAMKEIKRLRVENQALKTRRQERPKDKETVTLFADNEEKKEAQADPAQPPKDDAAEEAKREERRTSMEDRFRTMMSSRIQAKVATLQTAVKMDASQAERIQAFMSERDEVMMEYRRKRWSGELTDEEDAQYNAKIEAMKVGDFMKDVLSPEQYSEYDAYRKEQNEAELGSYASRQLSDLLQSVRLTDEQKDKAYEAFYLEAYNSIPEGEEFSSRRRSYGPESNNVDMRVAPLQGILDDQQMTVYRSQLETRAQAFGGSARGRGPR